MNTFLAFLLAVLCGIVLCYFGGRFMGRRERHRQLTIWFELTPKAMEELNALQEAAGARTKAELLRNALKFYKWFLVKKANGAEIFFREKDHEEEMPKL